MTTKNFINKCNSIHNNKYDYSLCEYIKYKDKVKIICFKHGMFEQRAGDHLSGKGCAKCSGSGGGFLTKELFIEKSKLKHGDRYYYPSDYINSKTHIEIGCVIHGLFLQTPNRHLAGRGCPTCNDVKLTYEKFVNKAKLVHGDKYDYSLVDYKNNRSKISIICPIHGVFKQNPSDHLNGCGCKICKNSIGEIYIKNFLVKNNIKYIQEHRFNNCRDKHLLPFDFYLSDLNICLEYNGKQHYEFNEFFHKTKEGFVEQQKRDKIKEYFCKQNNIKLMIIRYDENIIDKLNEFSCTNVKN